MTPAQPQHPPQIQWTDDDGQTQRVRWCSLAGLPPPAQVQLVDDQLGAKAAYRLVKQGVGLLWCGDFQNARHLLQSLRRHIDQREQQRAQAPANLTEAFHQGRKLQGERARLLGLLLLPFDADHGVPLPRAPDVRQAGREVRGEVGEHYVAPLRELLGLIGAHEWRKNGVPVAALGASIHPHHGVYSPVRGEYVALVAKLPLPDAAQRHGAADIGTGTGVLAALLAQRGLRVTATDLSPAALACAADNLARLGVDQQVQLQSTDLFPAGQFGLVVCNPPWVPAKPHSALDAAVYDPGSRMLKGFLAGLAAHLVPHGEGWLILSDLAERLGLRSRDELQAWISAAGLRVLSRRDAKPEHGKATDASDPLFAARSAEVTSLWRLGLALPG
jgi:methylase of polypeptide subunit release factors